MGLFINWITGFSLIESLLIGSIVSSTDAAAVFAIFRSRGGKKLKK
ncbi:MAG: cation:proton antiporter [Methanobacterium sp.]